MAFKSWFIARAYFKGETLSSRSVRARILNALKGTSVEVEGIIDQITSSWEHNVKVNAANVTYAAGDAKLMVIVEDDIFHYLDQGTAYRFALMQNGFVPKTAPGRMYSGPGSNTTPRLRGVHAFVSRKMDPRPGIKARKWTDNMTRLVNPILKELVDEAILAGLASGK